MILDSSHNIINPLGCYDGKILYSDNARNLQVYDCETGIVTIHCKYSSECYYRLNKYGIWIFQYLSMVSYVHLHNSEMKPLAIGCYPTRITMSDDYIILNNRSDAKVYSYVPDGDDFTMILKFTVTITTRDSLIKCTRDGIIVIDDHIVTRYSFDGDIVAAWNYSEFLRSGWTELINNKLYSVCHRTDIVYITNMSTGELFVLKHKNSMNWKHYVSNNRLYCLFDDQLIIYTFDESARLCAC